MAVNENNKYYTPQWLVKKVITTMLIILSGITITEIIEPSAGDGAFIDELDKLNIPTLCYDLYPEHSRIMQQDYLKLNFEYKPGRVVIGNPPFNMNGHNFNLWKKFCNKSSDIAEYIAFISPSSQYNNNSNLKNCDLIYSEYLGDIEYRGTNKVKVKTCLNVYLRNISKKKDDYINKVIEKDIIVERIERKKDGTYKGSFDCDYYLGGWGSVACNLVYPKIKKYAVQYGFRVLNEDRRNDLYEFLKGFSLKYKEEVIILSVSAPYISKRYIYDKIYKELYNKTNRSSFY
jgi:hypothetical protein